MSSRPDTPDRPARILIVDEERPNRQLLEIMLRPEGYVLLAAASGEDALTMVAQDPPDLVLLDVMMPGMNGYQVAAAIKGNVATKNVPIIMVTALDDRNAKMHGLSAGAEDFLTKPVDRAELCVRVRNLLRLKAYGDYYDKYSHLLEGEVASRTADLVERTTQAAVLADQAALLDLAQDAILVRDMHTRILFWSRGAEKMYGWSRAEAMGRHMDQMLSTDVLAPTEDIDSALLREGHWEGEASHHTRAGTRMIVASHSALQRDASGAPVRVLTINHDITATKAAESHRRLLTERLSLATSVGQVGVWEWDLASNTLTWDATMGEIYGVAFVGPVRYERWAAAVHHEDRPAIEARLLTIIGEKGQGSSEYRIIRKDGEVRNVSAVARAVLDEGGNVSRVIGVTMDVTERKVAEKNLEQSRNDQMRFKDDFLSHVSHELRSPLTAIKQFTSILLGGLAGELNKEQREYQEIVLKNIHQLQSMIDDLLEVTRLDSGKVTIEAKRMSVSEAVTDVLQTVRGNAGAKGVTMSCDLPPDLPRVYADQTRVRQILIILLDNAIKFTPDGGAVTIQARLLQDDPRFLLLEVSDTGCGISPGTAERIFERLYQVSERIQASRKGLGLGLYICKELVTRQGGDISAKRRAKQGSTFSFTLPVCVLSSVLAPLLKKDEWPAESVALVVVDVCAVDASPSKASREAWSEEVRALLERGLRPTLDVVLPTMGIGAAGERFFVAAFADEEGASVLADSIRGQFERLRDPREGGVTVSVSYSMLQPVSRDVGASTEGIVASMAASLEEAIKTVISLEAESS